MQRNWIGRSEGARVSFEIENKDAKYRCVYNETRYNLRYNFLSIKSEHSLVNEITSEDKLEAVKNIKKTHLKNLTLSVQI